MSPSPQPKRAVAVVDLMAAAVVARQLVADNAEENTIRY
jgi:hypothetical protein